MKTKNVLKKIVTALFTIALFLVFSNVRAQTKHKHNQHKMKDCCMMKDGKMMAMKDGKTMPMDSTMTMKNGITCMTNGECTMKDGKKMMMKEGDCMGMDGKMCNDKMKMMKNMKMGKNMKMMKTTKKSNAMVYKCPMHPEVVGVKGGNCPKCGMELVKK
jgi:hypothetical protein